MPDSPHNLRRCLRAERLAWGLAHLGTALLTVYCTVVTADLLPPLLLNPRWQFGLANVLVNRCFFALAGLGLWHLAGHLAPNEQKLQRRLDRLARLAVLAVVGFLLLMPLQLWSMGAGVSPENLIKSGQPALPSLLPALVAALATASLARTGPAGLSLLQVVGQGARSWQQFLFSCRWLGHLREAGEDRQRQRRRRDRVVAQQRPGSHFEELKGEDNRSISNPAPRPAAGRFARPRPRLGPTRPGRPAYEDDPYLTKLLEQAEREEEESLARRDAA
jgi:hypothetical protein